MGADERRGRLRAIEEHIRAMAPFLPPAEVERPCVGCGIDTWMKPQARYCEECEAANRAKANRANQRRRRRRETNRRQRQAGHLKSAGFFSMLVHVPCAHCGEPFKPERTTARYCSTRCRVAAHRAKQ
jgi:hypothetical protein